MKVSVVGTGYVGLVSGACLAEKGHHVVCVDIDQGKVDKINNAITPIHEKGLDLILNKNAGSRLEATTNLPDAVITTDLSIIAVGTPFDGEQIDLSYIKTAAQQIGEALKSKSTYHVVVVKSTVVPGTTDDIVLPMLEKASGKKVGQDFGVGMNPEFLREGEAVGDFMEPDRIVLGATDKKAHRYLEKLYEGFDGIDIIKTSNKTAEMIKYTSNSLLATMISFSNEIGNLCRAIGDIDVVDVMGGIHLDKRLSPIMPSGERIRPAFTTYLEAGCGFGGSCFPKDVKALISHGKHVSASMRILDAVMQTNEKQPRQIISLLRKHFKMFDGLPVAVLGLAFKPGTDDMRESPAIPIINTLLSEGAKIFAYDPVAKEEAHKIFDNKSIRYCHTLSETVKGAAAILLITRWDEFHQVPDLIKDEDPQPVVVDGRRMLDKSRIVKYEGIGL